MKSLFEQKIAVIGLGYVGLPLAVEFSRFYKTLGFDNDPIRVEQLRRGEDNTNEVETNEITNQRNLVFTDTADDLKPCDVFIITVPTPLTPNNDPDLTSLISASKTVGQILKHGNIVIYESTVYPGATEEICVPILENCSGLKYNQDFFCGYSPERINPGDKDRQLTQIKKITSGSNQATSRKVDQLYGSIIKAGTHLAPNIKVAEAAKVIENTQRDLNIALMNELSIIFQKLGINTQAVLEAAGTKWNFHNYTPGLVGGHCIGVDPYYLTYKAEAHGYQSEVILAGRRVNNYMGVYTAQNMVKALMQKSERDGYQVLVMGATFKENCSDTRNTRVKDIIQELNEFNIEVDIYDPIANLASQNEVIKNLGCRLIDQPRLKAYDGIIIAVGHDSFVKMGIKAIKGFGKKNSVIFDIKSIFSPSESNWQL